MFGMVLDKFSASLVKKSVGRKYAADSEEEAEWDGFLVWFGWHDVCGLCMEICSGCGCKLSIRKLNYNRNKNAPK